MKKILFALMFLVLVGFVSAVPETSVSYFYSTTCSHCANVAESGILDRVGLMDGVSVEKYLVDEDVGRDLYLDYIDRFGIERSGIPFSVIEQGNEFSYLMGDTSIIKDLEDSILNFRGMEIGGTVGVKDKLTLWVVVAAALIDSINPCAFGVLLFLMAVLLSMGSAKRALRSGMIYTFVIFVVYLAAGFGIMRFAGDFLALNNVKIFVGIFILIGALIELKDFFWEGKGISLKIPVGAKPTIEKYVR
ncbi:MAG: hypothetical protein KJ592_00405, partial [Nanoarchaeota archaeon]|nr:hypothetical protein [Nanoarchaeota archaeon]